MPPFWQLSIKLCTTVPEPDVFWKFLPIGTPTPFWQPLNERDVLRLHLDDRLGRKHDGGRHDDLV
jgi:hypothetical protein